MRVSTPGMPLAIWLNDTSSPWAFLPSGPSKRKGAWSDEKISNEPFSRPSQITCWFAASRGGGLQMHLAPSKLSSHPSESAVRNRYCGQVSAYTFNPWLWAQRICSTASRPDTCTISIGTSTSSARAMARWVASRSTSIGRDAAW
ncbi:hypothetical protein D3C80_1483610 [compost metagenome]